VNYVICKRTKITHLADVLRDQGDEDPPYNDLPGQRRRVKEGNR
jgi:hypothetical protein